MIFSLELKIFDVTEFWLQKHWSPKLMTNIFDVHVHVITFYLKALGNFNKSILIWSANIIFLTNKRL